MSEINATPSKFAIVNKIAAVLKLGDFGKIENFINITERTLTKEINALEKNAENAQFNNKNLIEDLNYQLEDALGDLENAYLNIDPKNVDTNEKAKNYLEIYLDNIKTAQDKIDSIKERITDAEVMLKDTLKDIKEQITKRNDSIKAIVGN